MNDRKVGLGKGLLYFFKNSVNLNQQNAFDGHLLKDCLIKSVFDFYIPTNSNIMTLPKVMELNGNCTR